MSVTLLPFRTSRVDETAPAPGILVVDDEPLVRTFLGTALRSQGYTVWLAATGFEALDLYRRHHPAIALVLLDVRMPRMDGPQTLVGLRQVNPAVRCCFMSGHSGDFSEDDLLRMGAACFLAKPFNLDEVLRLLRRLTTPGAA